MEELYTCEEVAKRYSVKKLTVWEWIRTKKLGAIRIGRDYRISASDMKKFDAERKTV